jgi:hypothetical protein
MGRIRPHVALEIIQHPVRLRFRQTHHALGVDALNVCLLAARAETAVLACLSLHVSIGHRAKFVRRNGNAARRRHNRAHERDRSNFKGSTARSPRNWRADK